MNKANNLRSRTTKAKLRAALIDLMLTTPLQSIRINKLCAEAHVGRSTFYEHYESIEELVKDLEETFTRELEELMGNIKQYGDGKDVLARTVYFFKDNKSAYLALFRNPGSKDFQNKFAYLIMDQLREIYKFAEEPDMYPFALSYATYGALYCIESWLSADCCIAPNVFSKRLFALVRASFDLADLDIDK